MAVRVKPLARLGALLGAVLLLLLGTAGTASAHAALISTDPAQGAVVATAPSTVTLTFSEEVTLSSDSVRVLNPAGRPVDTGNPGHEAGRADTARVGLNAGLANGTYTVAWRAISADTHPVGGAFTFSIGAPSATSVSASAIQTVRANSLVAFGYGTARLVAYAAFALLAGAVGFVLVCWPAGAAVRQVQRLLMTGWMGLLGATVAVLLLRGPYEHGSGIGAAFDLSLVRASLDERLGTALAARLLLLAAAGVLLALLVGQLGQPAADEPAPTATGDREEDELRRLERQAAARQLRDARLGLGTAGLVLSIALAATWAGADHAAVGIQPWLALPLDVLHLLAMAAWLGGLATLLAALRHGLPVDAVERFSRLAFGAVSVLVATGLYQAWRGVGLSWHALVGTEYGQLLLIKVGCVAAMVGAAWISRSWVARLRAADEAPAAEAALATTKTPAAKTPAAKAPSAVKAPPAAPERQERSADPRRRAQLARQQAARTAAGERRAKDGPPARAGLRRSVLVESCVAVLVLVVTTLLTNAAPGRIAAAAAPGSAAGAASAASGKPVELRLPFDTGGKSANAKGSATVTVAPGAVGGNTVRLALDDASGKAMDEPEVKLAFTLPDRDLGPLPVTLQPSGTGRWSGTVQLSLAGDWVVSVTVRSSDIDESTSVKELKVG